MARAPVGVAVLTCTTTSSHSLLTTAMVVARFQRQPRDFRFADCFSLSPAKHATRKCEHCSSDNVSLRFKAWRYPRYYIQGSVVLKPRCEIWRLVVRQRKPRWCSTINIEAERAANAQDGTINNISACQSTSALGFRPAEGKCYEACRGGRLNLAPGCCRS